MSIAIYLQTIFTTRVIEKPFFKNTILYSDQKNIALTLYETLKRNFFSFYTMLYILENHLSY